MKLQVMERKRRENDEIIGRGEGEESDRIGSEVREKVEKWRN